MKKTYTLYRDNHLNRILAFDIDSDFVRFGGPEREVERGLITPLNKTVTAESHPGPAGRITERNEYIDLEYGSALVVY